MVQGPSAEAIAAIREPSSLEAQIEALKQLKNNIVGHDQRKELVVKQGVVEPLVKIMTTSSKATGKRKVGETNGDSTSATHNSWTPEQDARLQAIIILGSLASAGPAFVPPLLAAGTSKHLLELLDTESSPKIITAALQVLRSLVRSADNVGDSSIKEALHITKHISVSLFAILEAVLYRPSATANQQLHLVVDIIACTAKDKNARKSLADHGALEALAWLLVSFFVANKYVDYRGSSALYQHSPPDSIIPDVLLAISNIVTESSFRTQSFILSKHIEEMMKTSSPINGDSRFAFGARTSGQSPIDGLLPMLHVPPYKGVNTSYAGSSAFPALASLQASGSRRFDAQTAGSSIDPERANAVLSWLLFFARTLQGRDRLYALRLVALVNNAIDESAQTATISRSEASQRAKEREHLITMLAIPLAMQFVQLASEGKIEESSIPNHEFSDIKEQACEVLALLIKRSKELQSAAVDASAIKRVCPALKKTFDNVPIAKLMWPSRSSNAEAQIDVPSSCKMGSRGLPPEIRHMMHCRQSALEAIAALSADDDVYRKAIIEAGVSTCIIDSLKPFPPNYFQSANRDKITPKDGNTKDVIIAACGAARAMARSVSMLRTSLIDAGVAKPVFELLTHHDLDIQITATDVSCNLLLDFSPMREDMMAAGVMKTLTVHARQSAMSLRLSSMWALKHLVLAAPREVKFQCLEELGVGWLVGAIQGDNRDTGTASASGGVSVTATGGLSTPNAAGQQVDLLNPASMDVDDPPRGEQVQHEEDEDGEMLYDEASSTHYQASQLRSTLSLPGQRTSYSTTAFDSAKYLAAVRAMEQNPTLLARRDDIGIQEQALDFIRNILNGEDCAEMFEHLLEQIGVDKIFSLLNDKLAPASTAGSTSAFAPPKRSTSAQTLYQPPELILSTVHVLCHIANGSPKHKQLLIAQKSLLQNWLPHFHHEDRRVRVLCVWTVNNLTWIEQDNDRIGAQNRVRELRNCGIEAAIKGLQNDQDLDVRERVRTALRQLDGL